MLPILALEDTRPTLVRRRLAAVTAIDRDGSARGHGDREPLPRRVILRVHVCTGIAILSFAEKTTDSSCRTELRVSEESAGFVAAT